jgi:hypothetical protein
VNGQYLSCIIVAYRFPCRIRWCCIFLCLVDLCSQWCLCVSPISTGHVHQQ